MTAQSTPLSTNYSVKSVHASRSATPFIRLDASTRMYRGFVEGLRQPTGLISLSIATSYDWQLHNLQMACKLYFSDYPVMLREMRSAYDVALCFGEALCVLQKAAGFPIFETVQIKAPYPEGHAFQLVVPMLEETFLLYLIDFMLEFINFNVATTPVAPDKALVRHIAGLIDKLSAYKPQGSNSLRFLQAAHTLGIPWLFVEQNTYQFGYGTHSRWFDSSFTDNTSVIASTLARSKPATSTLLRKAGLPVPKQHVVYTEEDALRLANQMGYPVVIKPISEDGGQGVFAGLQNDAMVKLAFHSVKNASNPVLLEKHILGKDYRLQVLNGKLIWAIERIPAGVVGDGMQSIAHLVDARNKQGDKQPIELTQDVLQYIAEQGHTIDSVPELNQFVALSRIANISAGGTPVGVFDAVHPDNQRLAQTAALLLRLDIAGIDLIMPDIAQSYLETGGAIIEVNAQPHLGIITAAHIYQEILETLLPQKGRIPIVVVFGKVVDTNSLENRLSILLEHSQNIGVVQAGCARINGELITSNQSLFTAGRSLLLNKTVDGLIYYAQNAQDFGQEGLPFDAFDTLFLYENPDLEGLDTLLKACRGSVIRMEALEI